MKASVIISAYNSLEDLQDLLPSIKNQKLQGHELEVILRDDGSPDNCGLWAKKHFPWIQMIRGENVGFSRSNNIAVQHATGDVLVFVNADTILDSGFVAAGLRVLEEAFEVGGVNTNMIMPWVMEKQEFVAGIRPAYGHGYFLSRYGFAAYRKINDARCETAFLTGGGCFVRRLALGGEAPFSVTLWGGTPYCEDLDLSLRLIAKGWRLCFEPAAILYHNQRPITGTGVKELQKFFRVSTNRISVYAANLSLPSFLRFLPRLLWGLPRKVAALDLPAKLHTVAVLSAVVLLPVFLLFLPFWGYQNFASKNRKLELQNLFSKEELLE